MSFQQYQKNTKVISNQDGICLLKKALANRRSDSISSRVHNHPHHAFKL